jgi:hypothetical protein
MGSPEKLYPPNALDHLKPGQKKRLQERINREIKKDPMLDVIIQAHRKLSAYVRKKIGPII